MTIRTLGRGRPWLLIGGLAVVLAHVTRLPASFPRPVTVGVLAGTAILFLVMLHLGVFGAAYLFVRRKRRP